MKNIGVFAAAVAARLVASVLLLEAPPTASLLVLRRDAAAARAAMAQELAASVRLSEELYRLAARLPKGATKNLLQSFRVCAHCNEYERLGETHDGGYLACMDGMKGRIRAAYSMGVDSYDKWSADAHRLFKVPVNQFDCTVDGPAERCDDCHFFKACIKGDDAGGAVNGKTSWTLEEALQHSGQHDAPDGSLLMKMDIEGAEWQILAHASPALLRKFRQIVFEFHSLNREASHPAYLKAVRRLSAAGFRVAHIHGNNFAGMYNKEGFAIPNVLEVVYVAADAGATSLSACLQNQEYLPLDSPNNPWSQELPLAKLP